MQDLIAALQQFRVDILESLPGGDGQPFRTGPTCSGPMGRVVGVPLRSLTNWQNRGCA